MRKSYTIILIHTLTLAFSQSDNFEELLRKGKEEFKKEFDAQDYLVAADNLEKAVKLRPNDDEAHYFLGYAYSRLNAKDGTSMINESLSLLLKCSNEFETVNRLTPKYNGEIVVLDPYSKLTAEWGSMAMCYWHNNKPDSSMWAFHEGKKRGGFSDFYLSMNKSVLDLCSDKSILISSGDNFTIPLWYLQIVNGYRKDVTVVDISLLNTAWYPEYLSKNTPIRFDLPKVILDTIEYCPWIDTTITIKKFSWTMKPSYQEHYVLRGDRIFLSLLKENNFKRDVYFTTAFNEESRLSLSNNLLPILLVDKLNINKESEMEFKKYKSALTKILLNVEKINPNSEQELKFLDNIRYDVFMRLISLLKTNNKKQAKELLELMDKYLDENKYPYSRDDWKKYAEYVRGQVQNER